MENNSSKLDMLDKVFYTLKKIVGCVIYLSALYIIINHMWLRI